VIYLNQNFRISYGSKYGLLIAVSVVLASLSACNEAPQPPEMPEAVDFQVIPAAIADPPTAQNIDQLRYRGGVGLQSRDKHFGSYSGLHVSPDLTTLTAVGWGSWLSGSLEYNDTGDLTGFSHIKIHPLLDERGTEVATSEDKDAEALYVAGGYYYVGFETNNRVWRYEKIDAAAERLTVPSTVLQDTPEWGGFSSITGTHDNRFLALTEGGQDQNGNTKGWIWDGSTSDPGGLVWLRAAPGWLPVDLTLLPNGDLLLVEVYVGPPKPYNHSRFSRINQDEVVAGNIMQAEPIALLAPPDFEERIEGIHATRGANDETLIYMISDSSDNWPTQILMFELVQPSQ